MGQNDEIYPAQLGARACPKCQDHAGLKLLIRTISDAAHFASVVCPTCGREASSEAVSKSKLYVAITEAINRWNSVWPDVTEFLLSDSEGIRFL